MSFGGSLTQQLTKLLDYDATTGSSTNVIYFGKNDVASVTSDSKWTIAHITYDASNNPTSIKTAIGAWDDRLTLTYR